MRRRFAWIFLSLIAIGLFFSSIFFGSVYIPFDSFLGAGSEMEKLIILESRIPRAVAALLGGASLSLGGLFMQTLFRNPLAGPSVLGLSSGAAFAVALVTLAGGYLATSQLAVSMAAVAGSGLVLIIILAVANRFADITSVLIVGLMLSFFTSAAIGYLQSQADDMALKAFVFWGFGSFSNLSLSRLPWLVIPLLAVLFISPGFIKPLNSFLPGEMHAQAMGVPVKKLRILIVIATGILTGVVTAFCGPIAFIGLAGPHIARMIFASVDHQLILPGSVLVGGTLALLCDLIARLPGSEEALPLNTVCALMGAPVVIYLVFKARKQKILL